jgi:diguanylate cyclase (GGDEF)-like protein
LPMDPTSEALSKSVIIMKSRVSKHAIVGLAVSSVALIAATILSGYFLFGEVSLDAFVNAQKTNAVLWVVDVMPFLFALWGQYVSTTMANEAEAMVMDHTQILRLKTNALESQAEHNANHDYLTGLPNRVLFAERIEQAISPAKTSGKKLGVLLLDLDRFKEIEYTLGHYKGDKVLERIAARLESLMEIEYTLSRMRGDEFGVLMPEISDERDLQNIAAMIRKAFVKPIMIEGLSLDVQVSIGAAIFPDHGSGGDTLIQKADVAKYLAKERQNGFVIYSPEQDQYSHQRLSLLGELRKGLTTGALFMLYQPKVKGPGFGEVKTAEALVRWNHSEYGIIPPNDFIPMAERSGMIKDLSKYVIKKVIKQIAEWQRDGHNICVSINLSAQDLLDPELPDVLAELLAAHEVSASLLVVEITETGIIADPERALQVMRRLAEMGVKMSIDDFGTGHSSMSYLKKMPVSEIKIDRSFVMDMMENSNDEAIVKATIDLAHSLGLEVVAEGVETQESADHLKRLGCDVLQGFLFSKPISPEELIAMAGKDKVH